MAVTKPALPRGTRDFGPEVMLRRNKIIGTIRSIFERYGFAPLETPAMELLSVLTGKYGDEGDQLIFKILDSGDFLKEVTPEDLSAGAKKLTSKIAEKALRYDLTVPFARFVVMHRNEISFPFKRYQIQPVWRADRPQKGRYREFYQCDADVVGTDSLLCEAEIIAMINEALPQLGIKDFSIKINNRKCLTGLAEIAGVPGQEGPLCVAIDKLDKIGLDAVKGELSERGFTNETIARLDPIFHISGGAQERLASLEQLLQGSATGLQGIAELREVLNLASLLGTNLHTVEIDPVLARGLSYYTGAIFEVKAHNVAIGSISGGGRYDNLTGSFGVPGLSGVGFSFGIDRVYDVMTELGLFEGLYAGGTQVLISNFDAAALGYSLSLLQNLRQHGISAELYPENTKLKKQFQYAESRQIPFMLIAGETEMNNGAVTLKELATGKQETLSLEEVASRLQGG